MINTESLAAAVKSLPEIELLSFMEILAEHLRKEKMEGLIDSVFEVGDDVHKDYRDEISDMEDKIDDLERDLHLCEVSKMELEKKIQNIKNILE